MKKFLFAAFVAVLLPAFTWAQLIISGTVSERNTGKTLPGTTIKLNGQTTVTGPDGNYSLIVKPGNYTLSASYVGYHTFKQTLDVTASTVINLALEPAAFSAEAVEVSATRAQGNAATTYKNIDKAFLEKNNFGQDLPFLLDNTPGVVTTSDAGAGIGYTGIRIRGSDATRVNVTINGIPYNDSESQGTFWVNMPDFASSVDNIQIQRGVGTSSNGAGSFGGSLNIQTSAPSNEPVASINNTYGSFNTLKNTIVLGSGRIADHFSFEGRLSRIKSDGFIDRAKSDLQSYFLSGAYTNDRSTLKVNVFAGKETTYQAWNGIPEAKLRGDIAGINAYIDRNGLVGEDANNLLSSGNRTYNSFTYTDQTDNYWQKHYQLIYTLQLDPKVSLNAALHYTDGRGYYEEFKADQKLANYGLAPVVVGSTTISRSDLVRRRWLDNDFYGVTYSLNYKPSNIFALTLAGAYNTYKGKHFGQVIYATYGSNGDNNRHYYDNKGDKDDFNVFARATVKPIDQLTIYADMQYRNVQYAINGTEKNLNLLRISDRLNFFNPKAGVSFNIDNSNNVYASFSIANKEPNRDDYINVEAGTLPQPERLKNIEAGYRFTSGNFNLGVNGYGMFYKDQLVVTGKVNDVGEYFRQNVAKSYRAGIEADAAYTSGDFTFTANMAWSRNKIKDFTEYIDDYDNGGQQENHYHNTDISFSPNLVAGGELAYKVFKGFAIALQGKHISKQYLDNTQNASRQLDAYWVNNVRLGYDVAFKGLKNLNLGLLINNVFNKKYESNGYTYGYYAGGSLTTENFYFPQAGTNFLLSLNLSF